VSASPVAGSVALVTGSSSGIGEATARAFASAGAAVLVNVFGTWAMSVAAMEALRESQGSIVNITSIAGVRPTGSSIPYAASKAALNHLTVLLAKVVGPDVRVNAVAPGLVDTPWTKDWDFAREVIRQVAPLKRSGQPDDVAEVVLALTRAAYVTGQVVCVDGGTTIAS